MYESVAVAVASLTVVVAAIAVRKYQQQIKQQTNLRQSQSTTSIFGTQRKQQTTQTEAAKEALQHLKEFSNIPVETGNETHEHLIEKLWNGLKPDVERKERVTRLWGQIGFQGTDPTTDFRGMGELALRSLEHIVTFHPHVHAQCLRDEQDQFYYFFAIAGINLCHSLYMMINWHHELANRLFEGVNTSDKFSVLSVFTAALADTWLQFDNYYMTEIYKYLEDGGNQALIIMQFEGIRTRFEPNLFLRWERAAQTKASTFFEDLQHAAVTNAFTAS